MAYEKKKFNKSGEIMQDFTPKETMKDIEEYRARDLPERGIRKETLDRFGVKVAVDPKDGCTPIAVYFPSYNQKDKITGYTKQDLTKSKEEKYHWSVIGSVSISNKLFGQVVAEKQQRKRNTANLVVVEGQHDLLAVFESCVASVKGTQYAGIEPLVVSIPMGTANAVESILHNDKFVESYGSLTVFFDDDHCTPAETKKGIMKGHEARDAVAGALIGNGQALFTISPDEGFKDASDYMQAGKSAELAKLVSFGKRAYSSEKIVKSSDITLDELLEPRVEGLYVDCFPDLMKKIHGFRRRELVLLTSPSGVGKSTVTALFGSAFIEAGERTAMIFLEENNKETLQRMIAQKLKVNYLEFKNNPLKVATREEILAAKESIDNNDLLFMLKHFGSMPISDLMAKIKHLTLVEGCKYIILDHLSLVISGSGIADERKELDMVMTELAAFCEANDVCIIAISHINRSGAEQFKPPKVKDGEQPKPFWVHVTKEMMRGSAALEQLSWIILGLEPEINPDRTRGRVRLVVLKNRPWSYLGVADTFTLDDESWEVVLCSDDEHGGF